MPTLLRNKGGFTVVELLVASVITMVGLLGLAQAMNYAADQNFRTQQRDEAVRIAEDWVVRMRANPFANLSASYGAKTVHSKLRSRSGSYTVQRSTQFSSDGNTVDLGVNVSWSFKGVANSHEVHSVKYNSDQP